MKKREFVYIGVIVLLIIIGIIGGAIYQGKLNKKTNETNFLYALNDSIRKDYDEKGRVILERMMLETDRQTLLNTQKNDSLYKELQSIVKEHKKLLNATVLATQTTINNVYPTTVTYDNDSAPVYSSSYKNKWIDYSITASKDTTKLSLVANDSLSIINEWERRKINGKWKKVPVSKVTNYSPYSATKNYYVYSTTMPRDKKFGLCIGPGAGAGVVYANGQFYPGFNAGINITLGWIPIKF